MAYIDDLLGRGEPVLYEAQQHLIVLVGRIITKLLLIGILIAAGVVSNVAFASSAEPVVFGMPPYQIIPLLSGVISLVLFLSIVGDFLRWNTERVVVTDRRVIQIRGVLSKTSTDMSLDKVNDVSLRQSLVGRLFNFGTVEMFTASEDGAHNLEHISAPLEFKRAMLDARHNYERGFGYLDAQQVYPSSPQVTAGKPAQGNHTVHQALEELASLRDRGILSIDEFEAKKRELLNRI